jgi:putative flippase GtrA
MAVVVRRRTALPAFPTGSTLRQLASFAAIGVMSTAAYVALYAALREMLDPTASNALALVITAVGNTAANRRLTFAVRDRAGALRDQVGGLAAFGVALAITTLALRLLDVVAPGAGRAVELSILVAANVIATVCRFLLLRRWIAGPRRASTTATDRAHTVDHPGAAA